LERFLFRLSHHSDVSAGHLLSNTSVPADISVTVLHFGRQAIQPSQSIRRVVRCWLAQSGDDWLHILHRQNRSQSLATTETVADVGKDVRVEEDYRGPRELNEKTGAQHANAQHFNSETDRMPDSATGDLSSRSAVDQTPRIGAENFNIL